MTMGAVTVTAAQADVAVATGQAANAQQAEEPKSRAKLQIAIINDIIYCQY